MREQDYVEAVAEEDYAPEEDYVKAVPEEDYAKWAVPEEDYVEQAVPEEGYAEEKNGEWSHGRRAAAMEAEACQLRAQQQLLADACETIAGMERDLHRGMQMCDAVLAKDSGNQADQNVAVLGLHQLLKSLTGESERLHVSSLIVSTDPISKAALDESTQKHDEQWWEADPTSQAW